MGNGEHKMYDIHMHIIPGVDDGSWSLEMSYSMLYLAYCQGIRRIAATPHNTAFDEHPELAETAFRELKEQLGQRLPEMELYLGCEVNCKRGKMPEVLEKLRTGIYPSMNQTRYVLTEFSTRIEREEALFCTDLLLEAGWIPVIAHVERYKNLFKDETDIYAMKERGGLFQINAYSLCEEHDGEIMQNARSLVEQKLVDFLGTDAHRMNHRPPSAESGLRYLYEHYDGAYVVGIAFGNAEQYLRM